MVLVATTVIVVPPVNAQLGPALPPLPKAWIAFDAATGAVVTAGNEHERRPVASTAKILTALIAVERLRLDDTVTVSERAAAMPARRIGLKAGERWLAYDLLASMLLVSANDAAVALADRIGGPDAFAALMAEAGRRLGMADDPVLVDPSGLDDAFSHAGGNRMSAWDLAVATRALLARDDLRAIVARPEYRFTGGDGKPHHLRNHNRLLTTYPGAIGVKTGYTKRAGRCLVAAATREGRTMVAVVLDAPDPYAAATALLDEAFATAPAVLARHRRLPPLPTGLATPAPAGARPQPAQLRRPAAPAATTTPWYRGEPLRAAILGVVGGAPAVAILVRRRRRLRNRLATIEAVSPR